jgi:hypothetical protein
MNEATFLTLQLRLVLPPVPPALSPPPTASSSCNVVAPPLPPLPVLRRCPPGSRRRGRRRGASEGLSAVAARSPSRHPLGAGRRRQQRRPAVATARSRAERVPQRSPRRDSAGRIVAEHAAEEVHALGAQARHVQQQVLRRPPARHGQCTHQAAADSGDHSGFGRVFVLANGQRDYVSRSCGDHLRDTRRVNEHKVRGLFKWG